jgi:hypothetical protein
MNQGIYEELVTKLVTQKLESIDKNVFYIAKSALDKEEASSILSKHLAQTIKNALNCIKGDSLSSN